MINEFVKKSIQERQSLEETVIKAIESSRQAFQQLARIESALDDAFGSNSFRRDYIDPVIEKERQISALNSRVLRGGASRTGDKSDLGQLLSRRCSELETLNRLFPWGSLGPTLRNLVGSYFEYKRTYLFLGDTEQIRACYGVLLRQLPIAC